MFRKIISLFFITFFLSCQDYGKVTLVSNLSRSLSEVSGLATFPEDSLVYAHADHNNPNHIYGIDPRGTIVQEIVIANAENEDWEDLATDGHSTLFIGDFGNNENDRDDLEIYHIEYFTSLKRTVDTAYALKTSFTLPDRKKSYVKRKGHNFDLEAFFLKDGFFYLFSRNRNRNSDFDGITKIYKIPARPGDFTAELIGSHFICKDDKDCFITGATLSPNGQTVLLLTYDKVIELADFKDDDFFGGTMTVHDLEYRSQKEGIAYKNKNTIYLADERRAQTGGNLYEYKLK